jgi:hypothetical protein
MYEYISVNACMQIVMHHRMQEHCRPACWQERQDFVDCVFVHSRCVQSGRKSFDECLREEGETEVHERCRQLFLGYLQCRRSLIDTRQRLR